MQTYTYVLKFLYNPLFLRQTLTAPKLSQFRLHNAVLTAIINVIIKWGARIIAGRLIRIIEPHKRGEILISGPITLSKILFCYAIWDNVLVVSVIDVGRDDDILNNDGLIVSWRRFRAYGNCPNYF